MGSRRGSARLRRLRGTSHERRPATDVEEALISPSTAYLLLPTQEAPREAPPAAGPSYRPDLRRGLTLGLLALAVAALVRAFVDLRWRSLPDSLLAVAGTLGFAALAVLAVRSVTTEVSAGSRLRFGDAHASVVGLLMSLAGYTATVVSILVLLQVPVQRLLVSGAVTGVILGIAAQQSLANVVAGLVLLLNRPFQVGHEITVNSGSLAGPYAGRVLSVGLTYVELETADGVVLLPNSGVLAAAVGPRRSAVPASR